MHKEILLAGSKGGGKGGGGSAARAPVEDPDTLRAIQYAKVIDLISEGEIEGLQGGFQGIYLDGTPIQNLDGSFNFKGVSYNTRVGTQAQTVMDGFEGVKTIKSVGGLRIVQSTPRVTNIDVASATHAYITMRIDNLTKVNTETGDIHGASVQYKVEVDPSQQGYEDAKINPTQVSVSPTSTTTTQITFTNVTNSRGFSGSVNWNRVVAGTRTEQVIYEEPAYINDAGDH